MPVALCENELGFFFLFGARAFGGDPQMMRKVNFVFHFLKQVGPAEI